jgi:c-di-GMP-binding flagellar brake protein YcgR
MLDRRKYQRDDLWEIVRYAPSPYTSDTVLRGLIKDWSQSGICLMTLQPLEDGQEIIVDTIVAPSSKKATVIWQQNVGKASYKVGLEFKR